MTVRRIQQLNECCEGGPIQELPRSFLVDLRDIVEQQTSNSCQCIRQQINTRQCGECGGLVYTMPALTDEIERLSHNVKTLLANGEKLEAENERLRAALRSIANNTCCGPCQEAAVVARAALNQSEGDV